MAEGIWFARRDLPSQGVVELIPALGEAPPGRGPVEVTELPEGWLTVARLDRTDGRILAIRVSDALAPHAPPMWLVTRSELDSDPPEMAMIAFGTPHREDGDVVPDEEFTPMPVRSDQQLAAVRWFVRTGQMHELYVQPGHRRTGIGTKLLAAAGTYAVASGWPTPWGNGERTELGEALVTRGHRLLGRRVTPLTRTLPPMTPGG